MVHVVSVVSASLVFPRALPAGDHHYLCFMNVMTKAFLVARACSIEKGIHTE